MSVVNQLVFPLPTQMCVFEMGVVIPSGVVYALNSAGMNLIVKLNLINL